MNTQTWIKRSEREPTVSELPGLGGHYGKDGKWVQYTIWSGIVIGEPCTHWRSIKCDPPARELTQRERDMEMVREVLKANGHPPHTWMALEAIYAERREVLRALQDAHGHDWGTDEGWAKHAQKLRARLDEQGAK